MSGSLRLRTTTREDAVLVGSGAIDLERVGAISVGPLDSDVDSAPGVLVFASTGDRPGIMMRFGIGANMPGVIRPDGAFTVFDVLQVGEEGFGGAWRSASGVGWQRASGYFCATRTESN